jgi:hypothetical protein
MPYFWCSWLWKFYAKANPHLPELSGVEDRLICLDFRKRCWMVNKLFKLCSYNFSLNPCTWIASYCLSHTERLLITAVVTSQRGPWKCSIVSWSLLVFQRLISYLWIPLASYISSYSEMLHLRKFLLIWIFISKFIYLLVYSFCSYSGVGGHMKLLVKMIS